MHISSADNYPKQNGNTLRAFPYEVGDILKYNSADGYKYSVVITKLRRKDNAFKGIYVDSSKSTYFTVGNKELFSMFPPYGYWTQYHVH